MHIMVEKHKHIYLKIGNTLWLHNHSKYLVAEPMNLARAKITPAKQKFGTVGEAHQAKGLGVWGQGDLSAVMNEFFAERNP